MRIEIWSDIVCPWCYVGKRRLEAALATFEHRDRVEIVWRAFQLDPGAPAQPDGVSMAEHLGRKYGGGAAAGEQMIDRMEAVAAEEGLLFNLRASQRVRTIDAHRLLHGAGTHQGALKEALLHAYFVENANVADRDRLTAIAVSVGMDAEHVQGLLDTDAGADAVHADLDAGADLGITGVPFFVFDRALAISGAQPVETFTQALHKAWERSHPVLEAVGEGGAAEGACGPEGCVAHPSGSVDRQSLG